MLLGFISPRSPVTVTLTTDNGNQHSALLRVSSIPASGPSDAAQQMVAPSSAGSQHTVTGADGTLEIETDFFGAEGGQLEVFVEGVLKDSLRVTADTWCTYGVS